jgi:hypothetical protein
MKCNSCGNDNLKGAKFCVKCGAQLIDNLSSIENDNENEIVVEDLSSDTVTVAKKLPSNKAFKFAIPVVLIIAAFLFISSMFKGSNIHAKKNSIYAFYDYEKVYALIDNKTKVTIEGELHSHNRSIDDKAGIMLVDYEEYGGNLWYVSASGNFKIDEDVYAYKLSDSGNGIIYLTDYDYNNDKATLYLYDITSKKREKISDEVLYYGNGNNFTATISPDGKSVSYTTFTDEYADDSVGYVKINGGATKELGKNIYVVAISDGGKYIYYLKNSSNSTALYVKSGKNETKLVSDFSNSSSLILNKDYSQIIFNNDGKAYISKNAKDKEKINNSEINYLILPQYPQFTFSRESGAYIYVYGVHSFENTYANAGSQTFYIDNKLEFTRISGANSAYDRVISADGKKMYYITSSNNLKVFNSTDKDEKEENIAEDVIRFVITKDEKTIYYVNTDYELWGKKGNKKAEKIADDVSEYYLALSPNSNKLFFLADYGNYGELYYSNNGGKKIKVAKADEVRQVESSVTGIIYWTVDGDVFRSTGNEKFELFQKEVENRY